MSPDGCRPRPAAGSPIAALRRCSFQMIALRCTAYCRRLRRRLLQMTGARRRRSACLSQTIAHRLLRRLGGLQFRRLRSRAALVRRRCRAAARAALHSATGVLAAGVEIRKCPSEFEKRATAYTAAKRNFLIAIKKCNMKWLFITVIALLSKITLGWRW